MRSFGLAVLLALVLPGVARAEATLVTRDVPLGAARTLAAARAPERFNLVGLHWRGPGTVAFRTRSLAGKWTTWRPAAPEAEDGPDPASAEGRRSGGWRKGNPYWTGSSDRIQYRLRGKVRRLRAHFVWSPVDAEPARTLAFAPSPQIVPRFSWGANERIRRAKPKYARELRFAVVHHTAGSNGYGRAQSAAIARGIQVYHVRGNGWDDIGYNFLVDRYGQVFEGRFGGMERSVIGAHALGFNRGSVGVAVLGNYDQASLSPAARDALARLLAWRLDVAHLDPLAALTWPSTGNARFHAGVHAALRTVSGHRDTGFTSCPGWSVYAGLKGLARTAAVTGLPKLYAPTAVALPDGRVRFAARLSEPLPWAITVTDPAGVAVGNAAGTGAAIAWTWDARALPPARYRYAIHSGPDLRPASGSVLAGTLVALTLADLVVVPSTVSPNGDGYEDSATISYTLGTSAGVSIRLLDAEGNALATLLNEFQEPGRRSFVWTADSVPDGQYTILVTALTLDGREVALSVPVLVSRTLFGFAALPAAFSPNGDGRLDTLTLFFSLASPASTTLELRRGGRPAATVVSGPLNAGLHQFVWDGRPEGRKLAEGSYQAVVTATDAVGVVSQAAPVLYDTVAPRLGLLSARQLRFRLSEPATVTATVNGKQIVRQVKAGTFRIPFAGRVATLRATARDAAGNDSKPVFYP